jgi:hypothetical protein
MRPIGTAYVILGAALLVGAAVANQALAGSAKPGQATHATQAATSQATQGAASPIYGVTIPEGYRKWQVIAPAEEGAPLDELRVVLGNPAAVKAIENATLPYPDGATFVKLAYKRKQSPDFESATVPGQPTTVQVMVKDSRRYASSGGWGYGRFINGQPADLGQHQTCFACHAARVKDRDYVFTHWAP